MLGLDNPIHILFLLVLLLVVFGAKRLPEMGRSLGSGLRGFRESLSGEPARPAALEQSTSSTPLEPATVAAAAAEPTSPQS